MASEITISSLLPAINNASVAKAQASFYNTTFIGIDFGTSTTVVTLARLQKDSNEIQTETLWLNQMLSDGSKMSAEKIPTVIAWHNGNILVGTGASDLKYQLKKGVNVWYSFKMELGEDHGAKYFGSELGRDSAFTILNPKDAARVFFQYLKAQITKYIKDKNLPQHIQYAVSIPASFEANQRKELVDALEANGMAVTKQALIDEPNAAFLSYVKTTSNAGSGNAIMLPENDNPKVLVFDFGAGTCDVSILELGKDVQGIYSKNLSISRFEKLGGDDIDWYIAQHYLFPALLRENEYKEDDFRTPERKRIIMQLLKPAEQLKILICEDVALAMCGHLLPERATSQSEKSVGYTLEIDSRKGVLKLSRPTLSYASFAEAMMVFLKHAHVGKNNSDFVSIFSPIQTAMKKANLAKDEIDYVLFIGGSCKNPYVQAALKSHFNHSEIIIPQDLQTHVSAGAAIHSLVYNGFNKNIIQPITSEPIIVITRDETPRVLVKAGTPIPCDLIVIDDLVTTYDGQPAIELPICLGTRARMLYNIKMVSGNSDGFKKGTRVKLELEINSDRLLHARASALNEAVFVEPINPFANKELTTEERVVLKAERQANIEAEQNGGRPAKESLDKLHEAYKAVGNDLRAAETLELLNELYPNNFNYNQIGVLYASAGHKEKSEEYYGLAYKNNKNATTVFNYAYMQRDKDDELFKKLLEESLELEPGKPHSLFELGRLKKRLGERDGKEMIEKAFNVWKERFDSNRMSKGDYGWLASAADELNMKDFAQKVRQSEPGAVTDALYDVQNLTRTARGEELVKQ